MEDGPLWEALSNEQQVSILKNYKQQNLLDRVFWGALVVICIAGVAFTIYW